MRIAKKCVIVALGLVVVWGLASGFWAYSGYRAERSQPTNGVSFVDASRDHSSQLPLDAAPTATSCPADFHGDCKKWDFWKFEMYDGTCYGLPSPHVIRVESSGTIVYGQADDRQVSTFLEWWKARALFNEPLRKLGMACGDVGGDEFVAVVGTPKGRFVSVGVENVGPGGLGPTI